MRRLRAVAVIVMLAVIWLGYSVAIDLANQRSRREEAVQVQALAEPGSSVGNVVYHPRKKAPEQVSDALGLQATQPALVSLPPAEMVPVPDAVAAAVPDMEPLADSPAHVPFLQSALSEAQSGVVPGRPGGAIGGATPPMWGFGGGGAGSASATSPVVTDDAPSSGDGRASALGHRFPADSEESTGGTGSNDNGGSNDSSGSTGSNGSAGSNDQSGAGSGSGSGGSSATGGSTQGGGSGQQATGGSTGGANNGSTGGGNGAINALSASVAGEGGEGTADVAVDVPEPGSILLGLGVAAALLRRRMR